MDAIEGTSPIILNAIAKTCGVEYCRFNSCLYPIRAKPVSATGAIARSSELTQQLYIARVRQRRRDNLRVSRHKGVHCSEIKRSGVDRRTWRGDCLRAEQIRVGRGRLLIPCTRRAGDEWSSGRMGCAIGLQIDDAWAIPESWDIGCREALVDE